MRFFHRPGARALWTLCFLLVASQPCRPQAFPGHWLARWIWIAGEAHPFHYFLMARRTFNLAGPPRSARLEITAADRYMLYVNGEYLGRGPARSDSRIKSYDIYKIESHLRSGKNVVAVLAYHYGCQNNYTRDERAGLFAQLEITQADGSERVIGTDGEWRVRHAEGWRRDVELINMAVGVTEAFDATQDPPDWMAPAFDDANWARAYTIPVTECPWNYLEARQIPMLREQELFPVRVVKVGEVQEVSRIVNGFPDTQPREMDVAGRLASDICFPLEHSKVGNPEAVLKTDNHGARVQGFPLTKEEIANQGRWSPYIIVDFGRPLFGFPRVRLNAPEKQIVEMTYGPGLIQDRVYPILQGVRYGDRYVTRAGEQTWQVFEYKQFRYLMIVFRNAIRPITVDSISLVSYEYPAAQRGRFECSDPVLTTLWQAAIRTTFLSLEDGPVADAIRERRIWTGDGTHELWAAWAGYGDLAITDWYFRLMARSRTPDGLLRPFYPGTDTTAPGFGPVPLDRTTAFEVPGNIPQHALVYITALGICHQYFGKRQLIADLYPALADLLGWFTRHADSTGLLYNLPYWQWVDWVGVDLCGANFETNALYYQALRYMSEFAGDLRRLEDGTRWKSMAGKVKASLKGMYWNGRKHLYVDSVVSRKQSDTITETANGMALMYGIAGEDQVFDIVHQLADPHAGIVRASPLFVDYTFEGLMKVGASEIALRQMRDRFAPMMAASDVPTLWERWTSTLDSDTAVVHGGAAGVAWTLSMYVLGVETEGVAFQKCRIEPHTGSLSWARGVLPSVRGDIEVEWNRDDKRFMLQARLPAGLETSLVLPRDATKDLRLTHNGKPLHIPAGAQSAPGVQVSRDRIMVRVAGGSHQLELTGN